MDTLTSVNDLLEAQLKDIYSAEYQLTKVLPKVAFCASNTNLKKAFNEHIKETQRQIERLKIIAQAINIKLDGKKCKAMEGLIQELMEACKCRGANHLVDASLVAAAQRIEHYEISAYGTAVAFAEKAGHYDIIEFLKISEDEEFDADEKLSVICKEELLADMSNTDMANLDNKIDYEIEEIDESDENSYESSYPRNEHNYKSHDIISRFRR